MRRGGRPSVAADEALGHIARLCEVCPGATPTYIARLAGVPSAVISRARNGARIEVTTHERFLAVREEHMRLLPPPILPSTQAASHVEHLVAKSGLTYKAVATASGVSHQTVYNLVGQGNRPQTSVTYGIHAAILSTTPDHVRGIGYWTDRRPSKTRVRALQANGWALDRLTTAYGVNMYNLVAAPDDSPIQTGVARRIEAMYDALGDTPGGSERAAAAARKHGARAPIYYDENMNLVEVDEETDDERTRDQARTALCILALSVENHQVSDIARMLGCTDRTVSRVRAKYGLRVERALDGGYVAAERWPGAIAAVRAATRPLHYRTTLDILDEPGLDYADILGTLLAESTARRAA